MNECTKDETDLPTLTTILTPDALSCLRMRTPAPRDGVMIAGPQSLSELSREVQQRVKRWLRPSHIRQADGARPVLFDNPVCVRWWVVMVV
jgi:hypothetical protein